MGLSVRVHGYGNRMGVCACPWCVNARVSHWHFQGSLQPGLCRDRKLPWCHQGRTRQNYFWASQEMVNGWSFLLWKCWPFPSWMNDSPHHCFARILTKPTVKESIIHSQALHFVRFYFVKCQWEQELESYLIWQKHTAQVQPPRQIISLQFELQSNWLEFELQGGQRTRVRELDRRKQRKKLRRK